MREKMSSVRVELVSTSVAITGESGDLGRECLDNTRVTMSNYSDYVSTSLSFTESNPDHTLSDIVDAVQVSLVLLVVEICSFPIDNVQSTNLRVVNTQRRTTENNESTDGAHASVYETQYSSSSLLCRSLKEGGGGGGNRRKKVFYNYARNIINKYVHRQTYGTHQRQQSHNYVLLERPELHRRFTI